MEYLTLVSSVLSQAWENHEFEILLLVILGIVSYRLNTIGKELNLIEEELILIKANFDKS